MQTSKWKKPPGSIDALHTSRLYPSNNAWGIPDLLPQPTDLAPPENLFAYQYRDKFRTGRPIFLHFHIDDYRFETVWNEPARSLQSVKREQIWAVASPDFSLWLEYPQTIKLWNTYRNRYVARYWQTQGVTVIPTVNWADKASYKFCFAGVPKGQVITLRTHKRARGIELENFYNGYHAMRAAVEPRAILWFGDIFEKCDVRGLKIVQFAVGHWGADGRVRSCERV